MATARESIIVRTRVKLRVEELSDEKFEEFFEVLEGTATSSAREVFGHGYRARIQAREGSLFLEVTIVGGAIGALILGTQKFLVDYAKMKAGLADLIDDSKTFVSKFRERFLQKARVTPPQIEEFNGKPVAPLQLITLLDELAALNDLKDAEKARRIGVDALRLRDTLQKSLSKSDWDLLVAALGPKLLEIEKYRPSLELRRRHDLLGPSYERGRVGRIGPPRRRRRSKTIDL